MSSVVSLLLMGICVLNSFNAASRYTMNNIGLKLSPCGVPNVVLIVVDSFPEVKTREVLANSILMSLMSSCSRNVSMTVKSLCRRLNSCLFLVLLVLLFNFYFFAFSHR